MKDTKEIKIRYKAGVQHKGVIKGEPYVEPIWGFVKATTGHVKRFNNALMLLAGIEGCEKSLMDWLADNMSEKNYVTNNEVTRKNFIAFHEKYGKGESKKYSDKTVSIAFQRLSSADFLVPVTRGVFLVNPLYYFAGDDASRITAIRMVMEFKADKDTKITVESK